MNDEAKKNNLENIKAFATGLFVPMAVIFIVTTILQKSDNSHWIGYVRPFPKRQWWVLLRTGLRSLHYSGILFGLPIPTPI